MAFFYAAGKQVRFIGSAVKGGLEIWLMAFGDFGMNDEVDKAGWLMCTECRIMNVCSVVEAALKQRSRASWRTQKKCMHESIHAQAQA